MYGTYLIKESIAEYTLHVLDNPTKQPLLQLHMNLSPDQSSRARSPGHVLQHARDFPMMRYSTRKRRRPKPGPESR